jgi:hypothetical protein
MRDGTGIWHLALGICRTAQGQLKPLKPRIKQSQRKRLAEMKGMKEISHLV